MGSDNEGSVVKMKSLVVLSSDDESPEGELHESASLEQDPPILSLDGNPNESSDEDVVPLVSIPNPKKDTDLQTAKSSDILSENVP